MRTSENALTAKFAEIMKSEVQLGERRKAEVRLPRIHGGRRQQATQTRLRTAVEDVKALATVLISEAESDY
jgi:hypothetical protein